jgi:hypothetical protein
MDGWVGGGLVHELLALPALPPAAVEGAGEDDQKSFLILSRRAAKTRQRLPSRAKEVSAKIFPFLLLQVAEKGGRGLKKFFAVGRNILQSISEM